MLGDDFEQRLDDLRAQAKTNGSVNGQGVAVAGGPIPPGTNGTPLRGHGENAPGQPGYYGMPVVKPPVWTWEIPVYFFVGGLSGMAAVIALVAWLFHQPALARAAVWTAAIGAGMISPVLLIMDLGRPGMFLNMLRVFKPQSAMSVGAWILSVLGACVVPAAAAVELHHWQLLYGPWQTALGWLATLLLLTAAPLGTLLATYTGVLIGATAIPAWFTHRSLLPAHFGLAGLGSATAWLQIVGYYHLPALRAIGVAVALAETGFWLWMTFRPHGAADRAVREGTSGRILHAAEIFSGPIALVLWALGWNLPAAGVFLAGAFLSRFGWLEAGRASGRDPVAVFASQS